LHEGSLKKRPGQLHRLTRAVADREVPLLHAHGIDMWDYIVLGGLGHGPAPTQAQLAASVRRDKTRLIRNLDRLETLALLRREPDPDDLRNRIVTLTACRHDIRVMESDLLATLTKSDQAAFIRSLVTLAEATDGHQA